MFEEVPMIAERFRKSKTQFAKNLGSGNSLTAGYPLGGTIHIGKKKKKGVKLVKKVVKK
jgi:hypothetical protein